MTAKDLVRNEVLHCQTSLVNELFCCGRLSEEYYYESDEEVLEWWLVTSYLARKLKERGEVVIEEYGCHWWGRQSSGQAIYLDWIMESICEE